MLLLRAACCDWLLIVARSTLVVVFMCWLLSDVVCRVLFVALCLFVAVCLFLKCVMFVAYCCV